METVGEPTAVSVMKAHRGEVVCADASGAWLVTGGGDGALRLWRWRRGAGWEEAATAARAHRYGVTAARWAPTGVLLASTGIDGAARIWAARSFEPRISLVAPNASAARAACWATSERLLVGHDDGVVRAWRIRDAALLACVRAHEGAVHALCAFGDASLLLTACTEGVLKVFNLQDICESGIEGGGRPLPLVWEDGAHDLGALCADASSCGRAAATGGRDARVRVWSAAAAAAAASGAASGGGAVLSGHGAAVTALRWARGTALLVSASLDRTARVWAVAARVCLRVLHAHSRYLTCVVVPQNAKYIITGSNDKTIRTWSLNAFSIDEDLEPECSPLVHFGLGDLEGIGPVDEDLLDEEDGSDASALEAGAACAWRSRDEHAGAVNCIATHGELLATACSDGMVRIFKWNELDGILCLDKTLDVHQYPVLSVDFGASGALLLSAGLDGRACLWDVQTGCELASLWAAGATAGAAEGEGGGGVRAARASPHRAPLLLLATDDGVAALWSIDGDASDPLHIYPGAVEACTCCAWAADGCIAAVGGAAGELRVLAPPPNATVLWNETAAHDLGVLSCEFAPDDVNNEEENHKVRDYLLASGGMDESVKLWTVEVCEGESRAAVRLGGALAAHGGAVQSVRWGARHSLCTAGADRWARVWRVAREPDGALRAAQVAAVPAGGAGGAPTAAFLHPALLAVGALNGRLALWRLPETNENDTGDEDAEGVEPRWWGEAGVLRWLKDYVTRVPGSVSAAAEEARLAAAVRAHALSGARLLDAPLDWLLRCFDAGRHGEAENEESAESATGAEGEERESVEEGAVAARLLEELQWLRRPPLTYEEEQQVPHALRCALSHAALRRPVRAPDGYTYEHAALAHWLLAAGAVSPRSGRRLRGAAAPNRGVLLALRRHCAQ
ncbi:uncharacterized protein [Epargyreus clarus]|uniref:uncharacterized protein n=1 Tax=Epargyreus clarus TaxID=520877 RepID=UPI003C2FE68E